MIRISVATDVVAPAVELPRVVSLLNLGSISVAQLSHIKNLPDLVHQRLRALRIRHTEALQELICVDIACEFVNAGLIEAKVTGHTKESFPVHDWATGGCEHPSQRLDTDALPLSQLGLESLTHLL